MSIFKCVYMIYRKANQVFCKSKRKKMMVKAVRVMLEPNNVQQTKMFQYAGAARFAYNWALAKEKDNGEKFAS